MKVPVILKFTGTQTVDKVVFLWLYSVNIR